MRRSFNQCGRSGERQGDSVPGRNQAELVIVGAGAAGLGAALTARELGIDAIVLEAMDRAGGRAYTRYEPFGFAWDAGCHWLHSASVNPFTHFADREGFRYHAQPATWHSWRDGHLTGAAEDAVIDGYVEGVLDAALQHGREGADLPIADFADSTDPSYPDLRYSINAEWGVEPGAASTLDLARYRDLHQNWPVEDGYGALVQRVAAPALASVRLNTPVQAISSSPSGVRVTTPHGVIAANAVIVTVSTNTLADEVIAFDPPLPLWKREAIAAVPLGHANKVALQVSRSLLSDLAAFNTAVPIGDGQMIGLRFRPYGRDLIDGYLGGTAALELEEAGEAAMVDVAAQAASVVLGSDVKHHIQATVASRWGQEPFIRGAYAAAMPGSATLRSDLALPIENRIFFAGEATSPDFFSTCHGAWESGIAATRAATAQIRDTVDIQGPA